MEKNMNGKLSTKTKILYGIADLGISLLTATIQFFLLFYYTDNAMIDPGLAELLFWWQVNLDAIMIHYSDIFRPKRSRCVAENLMIIFKRHTFGINHWLLFSLPEGLVGAKSFFGYIKHFRCDTTQTLTVFLTMLYPQN
jgi:Na+/melibiose symporter-like transporter